MKVLLSGMTNEHNQFGRAIAKYGCEVVHTNGDAGPFPTNCDAAVIVKCQTSHRKAEEVKDTYKALGKKFFVTDVGFSPIKAAFEEWLEKNKRPEPVLTPQTQKRTGFANVPVLAKGVEVPLNKRKRDVPPELDENDDRYIPPEDRYVPPSEREPQVKSAPFVPTGRTIDEVTAGRLTDKILASNLPQDKILGLLKRIRSGELTAEETITAEPYGRGGETLLSIDKQSIFFETRKTIIELTREQAVAIVQVMEQIEDFATGTD